MHKGEENNGENLPFNNNMIRKYLHHFMSATISLTSTSTKFSFPNSVNPTVACKKTIFTTITVYTSGDSTMLLKVYQIRASTILWRCIQVYYP